MDSRRDRFEEIAPSLVEPLRRYLARRTDPDTAEDVLAETMLVCWRRIDEVRDLPVAWAYGVARHCLHNAQRARRRQERVAGRIAAIDPPATTVPGPGERDDDLHEALAALRPDDAELLRMWAWEQLTPAEIATALGISANAASIRLHRARGRLRDRLRKAGAASGHEESREGRRP